MVEERGRRGDWRVCFWNVAGLKNKDRNFWRGLDRWEVIVLLETWVEERGWEKIKKCLPKGYKWGVQFAGRRSKKGRAMGGMLMGIWWEIVEREIEIETKVEGIIVGRVKTQGESIRIVGVYVNGDLERIIQNSRE